MAYENELSQIQAQRQALEDAQKQLEQQRQQTEAQRIYTSQQLLRATPTTQQQAQAQQYALIQQAKEQEAGFKLQVQPTLEQLKQQEQTIKDYNAQLQAYNQKLALQETARKYLARGVYPLGEQQAVKQSYESEAKLRAERENILQREAEIKLEAAKTLQEGGEVYYKPNALILITKKEVTSEIPSSVKILPQAPQGIDIRTGKPYGVLTENKENIFSRFANTMFQTSDFGKSVYSLPMGILQTTLFAPSRAVKFLSGESQRLEDIRQQKFNDYYQSEAMKNLAGELPSIVYFTPAGPAFMVSGGSEKLVKGQTWQEKALGLGELSLGALGVRSQIKELASQRTLRQFEDTRLNFLGSRYEGNKQALDVIRGYKKVGSSEFYGKLIQPSYTSSEGKFTLEGGKLITYESKYPNLKIKQFNIFARSLETGTPKIITTKQGIPVKQILENYQGTAGKIILKQTSEANLKLSGQFEPISKRIVLSAEGTLKPSSKIIKEPFAAMSKIKEPLGTSNNFIDIVGGKVIKARLDLTTGKTSFLAKPSQVGRIKIRKLSDLIKKPSLTWDYLAARKGVKTIQKQKMAVYDVEQVLNLGMKPLTTTEKTIISFPTRSNLVETKTKPSMATKTETMNKAKENQFNKIILGTSEIKLPKERSNLRLKTQQRTREQERQTIIITPSPRLSDKEISKTFLGLTEVQIPKEEQTQKQRSYLRLETPRQTQEYKSFIVIQARIPYPKNPYLIFPVESKRKNLIKQQPRTRLDIFESQIRRKGKWLSVGKGSFSQAFGIGISRVKQTLGASLRVLKNKQPVTLPKPSQEFRYGKRNPFILVQKSPFRLSSRGEKSEIQQARRFKKIKWF